MAGEMFGARTERPDLQELLAARVAQAVALRRTLGLPSPDTTVFRLVNSEGDRLSGLIVDVLGDQLVVASSGLWPVCVCVVGRGGGRMPQPRLRSQPVAGGAPQLALAACPQSLLTAPPPLAPLSRRSRVGGAAARGDRGPAARAHGAEQRGVAAH